MYHQPATMLHSFPILTSLRLRCESRHVVSVPPCTPKSLHSSIRVRPIHYSASLYLPRFLSLVPLTRYPGPSARRYSKTCSRHRVSWVLLYGCSKHFHARIKVHFKDSTGSLLKTVEAKEGDDLLTMAHEHDIDLEGMGHSCAGEYFSDVATRLFCTAHHSFPLPTDVQNLSLIPVITYSLPYNLVFVLYLDAGTPVPLLKGRRICCLLHVPCHSHPRVLR